MTPIEIVLKQLQILEELEKVTPHSAQEELSFQRIQEIIATRQRLIDDWPKMPDDVVLSPEVETLRKEVTQRSRMIAERDVYMANQLKRARNRVNMLLNNMSFQSKEGSGNRKVDCKV